MIWCMHHSRSGMACYQTLQSGVRSHTMHAQAQVQKSQYWLRGRKNKLATKDFFLQNGGSECRAQAGGTSGKGAIYDLIHTGAEAYTP